MPDKLLLKPGDVLLYRGSGFISWFIRVKSWSPVNHVEIYIGDGCTISARASGVNIFRLITDGLYEVWRPTQTLQLSKAMAWFCEKARYQRYDWWGLFRFFNLGKPSLDKQFCSEVSMRFLRAGGVELFNPTVDADKVSPGMFRHISEDRGRRVYAAHPVA